MNTQTIERKEIHDLIDKLPDSAIERLIHYAAFLRYEEEMEALEEAEDVDYIKAHLNEPSVPYSDIIKDYEAQHGPRDPF